MTYQFATGYDNTAGYQDIPTQPACKGIEPGRVITSMDRSQFEDGYSTAVLEFSVITADDLATLLTFLGLTGTTRSVLCTLTLPSNDDRTLGDYNCILYKPIVKKEGSYQYFWRSVQFQVSITGAAA